jgi:DNA-binding MarR family transcriptional regulator
VPEPHAESGVPRDAAARAAQVDAFLAAFDRLMRRLSAIHAPELLEMQLTMSQTKVLYVVLVAGSIRMSVLAARLGVALSTISGVVDRLVDLGYVDRRDDPGDRRQVVVSVTARGASEVDRLRELNAAEVRTLLRHVADADLDVLARAIEILLAASARADQQASPPGAEPLPADSVGGPAS